MNLAALQHELEAQIAGEVRFDRISRALYSTDASVYQIEPLGIVVPKTRDDVVRTVEIARRYAVSITARGGGTSQAGQAIGAGLQLDTSKYFNRIIDISVSDRTAWVEPGVVLDELNAQLKIHGLRFAPDISTASRATIGGMISNNSSGARSVLYGKTIDHVLELDVVLADGSFARFRALDGDELSEASSGGGLEAECYRAVRRIATDCAAEIERRFPKVLRRVGGYNLDEFTDPGKPFNLSRLIVGSEGTLGLIVAAKINLVPLPKAKAVLAIEFAELLDALGATPAILKHKPSAVEVMDGFILSHARENPVLDAMRRALVSDHAGALLCVELYGDTPAELIPRLEAIEHELQRAGVRCRWQRATSAEDQARIWSFREASLGLSMAMKGDEKSLSFVEDTAVSPDKLRGYIGRFLALVKKHGTSAGVYAHASVGCLHVRPVVNLKTDEGIRKFEAIANDVSDLVLEFGGALSGEHGDGLVRGPFTEKMFGPVLYDAFRAIKRTFDPDGLFNPGKIVDSPALTGNLRYGTGYKTITPATHFDYSDHGGMAGAVEMCSGLGACRKKLEGTMCPSYMATLDEKHSTRGRANVLRLTMAGRLGEAGLGDQEVFDVLDLCLECRACKAECPVGVDVARFKSEFLADYWSRHGVPARARAIGSIHTIAKFGSRFAPLSNVIAASGPARWLGETMFGIDRRRTLPKWSAETLRDLYQGPGPKAQGPEATAHRPPPIALFVDTFTNYAHPDIGLAAATVLNACGADVRLASNGCCGRPLISQGLLADATTLAEANVAALYDTASRGEPIVFLEPSCLSAVKEDAPALLRGELQRKAKVIAEASVLFESYLEDELSAGRLTLPLQKALGPSAILLHGHCHQKAMGLNAAARALLSRIPAVTVVDLDAGCCGMAGSFGYAKEHYEVSQQI
ncbi:MAG TPA: FAD-linked oxidase C-terminal domain-containing protein, partial [Vicinamibacterales bacterium]|nr:FAD-linked oxidase C-terminal domain-containing protein [Vicinamibacterales bacterium]